MKKVLIATVLAASFLTGCASVPMESAEKSDAAKKFNAPSAGNSGLYIYRSGSFGGALKKNILVDGKCVGESAPNIFFYEEAKGGEEHKLSTESEFSPNDLMVKTESGKNYFVQQSIKMGVMVGGAKLELVDEKKGKKDLAKLKMAKKGKCGK